MTDRNPNRFADADRRELAAGTLGATRGHDQFLHPYWIRRNDVIHRGDTDTIAALAQSSGRSFDLTKVRWYGANTSLAVAHSRLRLDNAI
jgi:hypothetical protein